MDLRKLKTLIDLVSESDISELEITEADGKVRIVKGGGADAAHGAHPGAVHYAPMAAPPVTAPAPLAPEPAPAAPEPEGKVIKAPMVGTFYRASSPGAKPMVEVGSEIKEGDPVCIIEAMKIMNEIDAEFAGRVTKILVENGQAVEFGQPLFIVE
jgi:acetyl-CoA carboxylase biotin carboxyl carrier protein